MHVAGETVEEQVDSILVAIEKAATNKKRQLRTGYDYNKDDDLWITQGYNRTKNWEKAKHILEELGYKVSFYYRDGLIAVDMYTLIEW